MIPNSATKILLFFFCISSEYSEGKPQIVYYGNSNTPAIDSNSALRRTDDFYYNRAASMSYPFAGYGLQNGLAYAAASPYLQQAYQPTFFNTLPSVAVGYPAQPQGLAQYYAASAGLPPPQPSSQASLLTRPANRLANGLSGVLDVISAGLIERKLRRLPPHYFYPPPVIEPYPFPLDEHVPSTDAKDQDDLATGEVEGKNNKQKDAKEDNSKPKEENKTSESEASNLVSQHLQSWPKLFTIMGSGVDGFFGGIHATRKEISKMTGQLVSKGILMGGSVVHDVTSGVATMIEKITEL